MKRTIFIMMMFAVCTALVSTEQTEPKKPVGEEIVGTGCVGECGETAGPSATIEYTVASGSNVLMIVKTVERGLCMDTGVYAFLFKNGKEVANGHINQKGDSIKTKAAPGDKIVAYALTYPLFNGIICIRLGELKFNLIKKNVGKKVSCLP